MSSGRISWVLLAYRLPREPSTPRSALWRKLRRLGAAQVLDGLAALLLDQAAPILGGIFQVDLKVDSTHPVCEMTRTTISALRIGDYVIGTMPGEMTVLLSSHELGEIDGVATHVAFLDEGKLLFQESMSELMGRFREVHVTLEQAAMARRQATGQRRRTLARLRRESRRIRARDYFPPPERELAQRALDELVALVEEPVG